MALLEVDDLRTHFFTRDGVVRAVDGVTFSVEKGKTLGIVGESGCGKSVTALSIMGLIPKPPARIVGGSITFEGRDLAELSDRELETMRGRKIAMIFQDPMTSLNPTLKIGTQITETMRRHLDVSKDAARRRAIELLEEVRIPRAAERIDDYPHRFSGGMRQRVMIAIALSCNPALLIADEPTTALDVTIQAQILELIAKLRDELGMGVLLITHDLGIAAGMCDRVNVMYAGRIVESAPVADLFAQPQMPYTRALLDAIPTPLDAPGSRLRTIEGQPPAPQALPPGCRFAPRCAHVRDVCRAEEPGFTPRGRALHGARCWATEPEGWLS
jgi:oligopeptide transport system ATP-binding protein